MKNLTNFDDLKSRFIGPLEMVCIRSKSRYSGNAADKYFMLMVIDIEPGVKQFVIPAPGYSFDRAGIDCHEGDLLITADATYSFKSDTRLGSYNFLAITAKHESDVGLTEIEQILGVLSFTSLYSLPKTSVYLTGENTVSGDFRSYNSLARVISFGDSSEYRHAYILCDTVRELSRRRFRLCDESTVSEDAERFPVKRIESFPWGQTTYPVLFV